jgi:hypothetical protein
MAGSGFVEIEIDRRRRGRPRDPDRRVELTLADGCRLGFSSGSDPGVVRAVVEAVLRVRRPRC